jgi:hypothetical protein
LPWRRGINVIASAYRTEDPGFESCRGVRFKGIYTLQYMYALSLCVLEKYKRLNCFVTGWSKQSPNVRKIAQSGHPALSRCVDNCHLEMGLDGGLKWPRYPLGSQIHGALSNLKDPLAATDKPVSNPNWFLLFFLGGGEGSATPCGSPPPLISILSDYSFLLSNTLEPGWLAASWTCNGLSKWSLFLFI